MTSISDLAMAPRRSAGRHRADPLAWLVRCLLAERARWSLWLPVGFGAGIALYFALPTEPPWWLGSAVVAALAAAAIVLRRRVGVLLLLLACAVVAAGFGRAQLRTLEVAAPVLQKRLGPLRLTGLVETVEPRVHGYRLTLRAPAIPGLAPETTPVRIRIALHGTLPPPQAGQTVRLRAVLQPPAEPAAPGAFDFARQAYFQRLGAVGYAYGGPEILADAAAPAAAGLWLHRLRQSVAARVLRALPGESGPVAAALMTGVRGAIPEDVMAAMRDSGLAHLLAISGLHMGLVAGLLFFALRAGMALLPGLALRRPIKKWAAFGAILGAFGYLLLTGATVPTQRAFVMVSLVLLAVILDRRGLSLRLVAWAAAIVLALAPESLLSASFQMSFAAVIALIAGYEVIAERGRAALGERRYAVRCAAYLGGVAATSLIAGLATAPFALYHFNRIAWYGLLANLLAVPLTAFWIMPCALAAFALMPFGLEGLALAPMGWGIDLLLAVARGVAALPGAVSLLPAMPLYGLALVALGGLWLCLWRRAWRLGGLLPVALGLASIMLLQPPDVLATGDGRLLGLRGPDGELLLSTSRSKRFEAEVWQRRLGLDSPQTWREAAGGGNGLTCDPLGCLYRRRGQSVALVRDGRALIDDCAAASVVVSTEPIRRAQNCVGPRAVIDRFDLWRAGGHAVWLSREGVRVESVAQRRGRRPWVRRRGGRGSGDQ